MRLLVDSAVNDKIKGLILAGVLFEDVEVSNLDDKSVASVIDGLKKLCLSRFSNADFFISSKFLARYRSFFRDILKKDLVNVKPLNEVYTTMVLSGQSIDEVYPIKKILNYLTGATGYPIFGFNVNSFNGDLVIRYSKIGEAFHSALSGRLIELNGKEVVLAAEKKLLFLYPYDISVEADLKDGVSKLLILACGVPGVSGLNLLWALKYSVGVLSKVLSGKPHLLLQEVL